MYSSSLNTKLSWLDIVAGYIHIKYKVSKEMAYEAAQEFNNPHMSVQKCVWFIQIDRFHSRIEHYLEDYLYDLIKDTDALIPDGVLCMWSAWYFYDMADTVPDYIQELIAAKWIFNNIFKKVR